MKTKRHTKVTDERWAVDINGDIEVVEPEIDGDIVCIAPNGWAESMQYWAKRANIIAAAPLMYDFLKKHEAWEARLIECDEAWEGRNFAITDELYEEFNQLQILRNEILAKAEGRYTK